MKKKSYYWTVVILLLLVVAFVVVGALPVSGLRHPVNRPRDRTAVKPKISSFFMSFPPFFLDSDLLCHKKGEANWE